MYFVYYICLCMFNWEYELMKKIEGFIFKFIIKEDLK